MPPMPYWHSEDVEVMREKKSCTEYFFCTLFFHMSHLQRRKKTSQDYEDGEFFIFSIAGWSADSRRICSQII